MDSPTHKQPLCAARWPLIILLSLLGTPAGVATVSADESRGAPIETTEDRRIDTSSARPVQRKNFRLGNDKHTSQRPPAESAPRRSLVAKAAHNEVFAEPLPEVFHDSMRIDAGCGFEPGCGVEAMCGVEAGCGIEAGCGFEPGCGVGTECGIAGCDGGCAPATCDSPGRWGIAAGRRMGSDPCATTAECIPFLLPVVRINWSQFEFFGGVQAFSGPPSFDGLAPVSPSQREGTASFGLHEGFNFARPLSMFGCGFSSQFGLRATQTNASGAEFTRDNRRQLFLTAGLFRRVDYGLQGGLVVDYLHDDWHYEVGLTQLRGELSWVADCNEIGFGFMSGLEGDTAVGTVRDANGGLAMQAIALEGTDQNRFFYRRHFRNQGNAELFAGWTEDEDGLLGAALQVPLLSDVALRTGFTYLNPDLMGAQQDHQEETWNVGVSLVWYPCAGRGRSRYNRPLFEVADNGTFIVDRQ